MKHKYAEMIKAKADNMELVLFTKRGESSTWGELNNHGDVTFLHEFDYFLCLPQHKEAVLNALNGGESQLTFDGVTWNKCNLNQPVEWSEDWWYMKGESQSRIKPKKEKRLIAIDPKTSEVFVATSAYIANDGFQLIEIEVEV